MEVDRLRDYMQVDTVSWNRGWRDIDRDLNLLTSLQKQSRRMPASSIADRENTRTPVRNKNNSRDANRSLSVGSYDLLSTCSSVSTKISDLAVETMTSEELAAEVRSRPSSRFMQIVNRRPSFEIVQHPLVVVHELHLSMTAERVTTKRAWPSKLVDQGVVEKMVKNIWDTYLSETSNLEICVSPLVLINTVQRISCLDLYGADLFTEALFEPLRTIQMDILPRFFASKIYAKMKIFLLKSQPTLTADSILVPPPPRSFMLDGFGVAELEKKRFNLNEILQDGLLYGQFLAYLRVMFRSEYLLCVRMILLFEEQVIQKNFVEALRLSWYICDYFVTAGSAFEVALTHAHRKDILLSLARPNIVMFSRLKSEAVKRLEVDFKAYSLTVGYSALNKMMISASKKERTIASYFSNGLVGRLTPIIFRTSRS